MERGECEGGGEGERVAVGDNSRAMEHFSLSGFA